MAAGNEQEVHRQRTGADDVAEQPAEPVAVLGWRAHEIDVGASDEAFERSPRLVGVALVALGSIDPDEPHLLAAPVEVDDEGIAIDDIDDGGALASGRGHRPGGGRSGVHRRRRPARRRRQ